MADGNGMTLTNISFSRNLCIPGETLSFSVTVKNGSGVNIPDFRISLAVNKADFTGNENDRHITYTAMVLSWTDFPKGKTMNFPRTEQILENLGDYFAAYPDVRAVPVYITYIAYDTSVGNFSHKIPVEGLEILNTYYQPRVTDFDIERRIENTPNDEGVDVFTTMQLDLSDAAGAKFMQAHLYFAENAEATQESEYIDLTARIPDLLIGVTDSTDLIFRQFSNGANWDFLLVFGDQYESTTAKWTLARAFANLHLSGETTGGVCFGGFSTSTLGNPKMESHYPGFFYAGIHGVTNYEDGEVATGGRWIDNKPIYRSVHTGSVSTSGRVQLPQITPCTDIETIINISGMAVTLGGSDVMSLPHVSYADLKYAVGVRAYKNGAGELYIGSQYSEGLEYIVFIEYTKASDEPVIPDDGTAPLIDSEGIAVADAGGTPYAVRAYNADQYISAYTGREIDAGIAKAREALSIYGGNMEGMLTLCADPTNAMDAVTKQFMEAAIRQIELTPGEKGDTGVGIVSITIREVTDPDESTGEYVAFTDSDGRLFIDANNNSFMTEVQ